MVTKNVVEGNLTIDDVKKACEEYIRKKNPSLVGANINMWFSVTNEEDPDDFLAERPLTPTFKGVNFKAETE